MWVFNNFSELQICILLNNVCLSKIRTQKNFSRSSSSKTGFIKSQSWVICCVYCTLPRKHGFEHGCHGDCWLHGGAQHALEKNLPVPATEAGRPLPQGHVRLPHVWPRKLRGNSGEHTGRGRGGHTAAVEYEIGLVELILPFLLLTPIYQYFDVVYLF